MWFFICFFFFQAEDGIRDHCVTGVQTCALPIWWRGGTDGIARCPAGGRRRVRHAGLRCPARASRPEHRSEEHTSELQSHSDLVCRLLLEKKKKQQRAQPPPPRRLTPIMTPNSNA